MWTFTPIQSIKNKQIPKAFRGGILIVKKSSISFTPKEPEKGAVKGKP